MTKPVLYILGGAIGSGKTTWYQYGIANGSISREIPFINIDVFFLREMDEIINWLKEKGDFIIECNLSKSEDYEWIDSIRKSGYRTVLYFFGTRGVDINKMRVRARLQEGGHDVAESMIEECFKTGLTHLKGNLPDFSEATLIDVSGLEPQVMAKFSEGKLEFRSPAALPWVEDILK
jgi:predicted ABC-type ATPase